MRSLLLALIPFVMFSLSEADLPARLKALPPDIRPKVQAIHENKALTKEQRGEQIYKIMSTLPDSVLDSLPKPPGWDRLPQETRDEMDKIRRDKSLTFQQHHQKMKALIDKLPPNLRPPHPDDD
ncbi:hypothetical protein OESDEN_09570 [Oesophagostomum dentatum]|uniref:SXP/RAL-2 family protein Ani s 5-like cation-binding domain-containing protein n=1 Tax=Oesophagostomum dentatum TaxID=61180 RepID=A0A0B1T021_OESDE|nr:hypothetical protein OESDEN_09570 [Oesophagostomum dentatum]